MDATRIADNKPVYIKRVPTNGDELKIALMFNAEPLRHDPRNHCVPILDHFQDPDDSMTSYMVMPFLRPLNDPVFKLVDDIISFVDQILEAGVSSAHSNFTNYDSQGLVFLHEHGVAHRYATMYSSRTLLTTTCRDCAAHNILMDASALYPRGHHPVNLGSLPDVSDFAPHFLREEVAVKYYYVDFGLSSHIPPDSPDKLVVGEFGREQDVPELSNDVPYDPFKVDVFIIGSVFKKSFEEVRVIRSRTPPRLILVSQIYTNVGFLRQLIKPMTDEKPAARPSAVQALEKWRKIRSGISPLHRSWRLRLHYEDWIVAIIKDIDSSLHFLPWLSRRMKARFRK